MSASYKNTAWFYDRLSRLVYGPALVQAQVFLLKFIPPKSSVLIVGGGTGWILEDLTKIHPSGLNITYCEVAPDMMARSKKRDTGQNKVVFINDAIEHISPPADFDVVMTPFLFDNFTRQTFEKVFGHIHHILKPGGLWLNCDFQLTGKLWQLVLLKAMFLFFRLICGIEGSRLPDIKGEFKRYGYASIEAKTFYGDFIIAGYYTKNSTPLSS